MGEKWNDSRPAEKLLALYTMLLVNPRPMTLTAMAKKLECSKQTVGRLIDQLESSRYGMIVRDKLGRENVYSLARPERRPCISLSSDGLTQLALCREFLLRLLPPTMARQMENSLNQAAAYLPADSNFATGLGAAAAKGRIDYAPFEKFLQIFIKAIISKKVCRVAYRSKRHVPVKEYDYAPKRLVAFHESIFVLGYVVNERGPVKAMYDKPTLLAVHRLIDCQLTQRRADTVPEPPADDFSTLGIMQREPFAFTIRFTARAATYAAERQWSANQTIEDLPDGGILLHADAASEAECLAWILGFGDSAEVLEPDWFRKLVKEKIQAMLSFYTADENSGQDKSC